MVGVFAHPEGEARPAQGPRGGLGSREPTTIPRPPTGGGPLHWPSQGPFRCLYGPARTPPVQPRFSSHVDVAPQTRAKVALDQVRQGHQKKLRELTSANIRKIMGWVTPPRLLGLPTATPPRLRRFLQRTGNTAPARDRLQY